MIELKTQYPYNGNKKLIRYYASDETNNRYYILQQETNIEYVDAVDIYPSAYTYSITNHKVLNDNTSDVINK